MLVSFLSRRQIPGAREAVTGLLLVLRCAGNRRQKVDSAVTNSTDVKTSATAVSQPPQV
jgi:hypothetical protein